uniref:non-specific serine/threonine protein kinase n=1 Tax=Trichuris muris TaxID=70415 RepID=A0A5S6QS09_TRIMR
MTNALQLTSREACQFVGPYKLERTLGKGQTGLVKLGTHLSNGRKVAIKIIRKEKLSDSVLMKVEREIAIMKLIDHPYILRLYDVYENRKYLYLVLEHVSGGELFDYLVRKGRLPVKEARKIFRQIICALDYCHAHNICHRDLKPENLLLDERACIKIADFGMASLQVEGSLLETSCGSPHYACPEVIRGEKYDGKKADIWSCGVILYALLVGALPFDDDNLRHLLEKVKRGVFHIPHFIPAECQSLLRGMIEVNVSRRMTLDGVFRHSWVAGGSKLAVQRSSPMLNVVQTLVIPSEDCIDVDVLRHMISLSCFGDRDSIVQQLLNTKHNTEKVVYFVLLDRKFRNPLNEEDSAVSVKNAFMIADPPLKRTEQRRCGSQTFGALSDGSPLNPGRHSSSKQFNGSGMYEAAPSRTASPKQAPTTGAPFLLPRCFGRAQAKDVGQEAFISSENICSQASLDSSSALSSPYSSSMPDQSWRLRSYNSKRSFMNSSQGSIRSNDSSEDSVNFEPTDLVRRSWFSNLSKSRSDVKKEDELYVPLKGRSITEVKTLLTRAFLAVNGLNHTVSGQSAFLVHLRSCGRPKLLSKTVKIDVSILKASEEHGTLTDELRFIVKFTLLSGPYRRFCRFVDHITALMTGPSNMFGSDRDIPRLVRPRRPIDSSATSLTSQECLFR